MSKILLDFIMPVTSIVPTSQASTAFLKQALLVVKPKDGATEDIPTLCTSMGQVSALTDNLEAQEFFNGGQSRIYILATDDLVMASILDEYKSNFFTVIISSDFSDAEIDAMTLGTFKGVIATSSTVDAKNLSRAAAENGVAFHTSSANKAKNMLYAFGKLLSNAVNWTNQQYIQMPFADDVDELGEANTLFDDKISFVLTDDEYLNRLGLFAAGGKAIVSPYIKKNLEIDLQSDTLSYISGNQPSYTFTDAAVLEAVLQKRIELYKERKWITEGTVEIRLEQENFVASGYINISEPKALWKVLAEMRQTL